MASAGSRSALQALELPRCEATIVQMVAPDLWSRAESSQHTPQRQPLRRRGSSKFKLELHLAGCYPNPADRTTLASARAGAHAIRLGRRQLAALYRCSSFVSEEWLVERGSGPRMALPVHAHYVAPAMRTSDGRRAEMPSPPMLSQGPLRAQFRFDLGLMVRSAPSRSCRAISTGSASISTALRSQARPHAVRSGFPPR